MNEASFFGKIQGTVGRTSRTWMKEIVSVKRRLTILEGKDEQDDSEQVGGGYYFSESLKIDLPTS